MTPDHAARSERAGNPGQGLPRGKGRSLCVAAEAPGSRSSPTSCTQQAGSPTGDLIPKQRFGGNGLSAAGTC